MSDCLRNEGGESTGAWLGDHRGVDRRSFRSRVRRWVARSNERFLRGVVGRGFRNGSQGIRDSIVGRVFRGDDIGWAKAAPGNFVLPASQGLLR